MIIERKNGYKNKLTAQNVGIAVAKTTFEMLLDSSNHAFMTSWNNPRMLNRAGDDLFIYFSKTPKNIEELKIIANEAAKIEFENLKSSYQNQLPIKQYDNFEIIQAITDLTTNSFLMLKQMDFYAKHKENKKIDSLWKDLFIEYYSVEQLLGLAKKRSYEIFEEKSVSIENQTIILKNIEMFWNNIIDLKSMLYSST